MISIRTLSRTRAAAYHLALSATIGLLVLSAMLMLWYPPALFAAMGGKELILLLVGVDVTLGPLITLIIFNPKKKELPFDLGVIATLQVAALCYGIFAMHAGRPVFTVYADEHFVVVPANEIDPEQLRKGSREEFQHLSETGPLLVATQEPDDIEERNDIVFLSVGGLGIQNLPRYYVPYDSKRQEIIATSRPLADLALEPADRQKLDAFLAAQAPESRDAFRCLPVKTRLGLLTAIIDGHSGDLVKILSITPLLRQ